MAPVPNMTFKDFASNPITAMLFLCIFALGTMWYQNKKALEDHIEDYRQQVTELKKENQDLRDKYYQVILQLKEIKQ